MQSSVYEAIKMNKISSSKLEDHLVVEAALQIDINGAPYTVVMRTPGDDKELVRGLLYAEDIYKHPDDLKLNYVEQHENGFAILNAAIPKKYLGEGYLNKRTLLSVSSCGICGKQQLSDVELEGAALKGNEVLRLEEIKRMYIHMKTQQGLFESTGGSHATAAYNHEGAMLSIKEDIGRHNALDKVIGHLLNEGQLQDVSCVLVSGRISYEIVAKAFMAKIPIIVAVSACSTLAVDYAKEFGICLIGFNRDDKATIYANPQYISN